MDGGPVTKTNGAPEAAVTLQEQRAILERVLRSEVFRSAPNLQKFLEYVTCKAIDGLSHEIKEFTIGSEVFGRTSAYDPKIDTTVRVQAHRLREKLKEYYEREGAAEEILLVMPKGHYVPSFLRRSAASANSPAAAGAGFAAEPSRKIPYIGLLLGLSGMVILLAAGLILSLVRGSRLANEAAQVHNATIARPAGPLKDLWADFLKDGSAPIVAYSNTAFLTTQTSDLLRLKSDEVDDLGAVARNDAAQRLVVNPRLLDGAGTVFFQDVYTGTGEVMGVFYLTQMFGQFRSPLGIKRTRLLTTDDLTHHDLIFLGSTRENSLLQAIPLTQDFVFAWPTAPGAWSGRILNLHPRPGENPFYEVDRDPQTRALRADYVLVSFLPGMTPDRKIAILGGLTTLGTQAATEFATSATQIAELEARFENGSGISSGKAPTFFQAVLRVEIMKGDVLRVKYITSHAIHSTQYSPPKN